MATTVDRAYFDHLTNDPLMKDRFGDAIDTIDAMKDGPVPLIAGSPRYFDVRAIMFFEAPVEWNCTGTEAFVWGYDKNPVFAKNWAAFLQYLGR